MSCCEPERSVHARHAYEDGAAAMLGAQDAGTSTCCDDPPAGGAQAALAPGFDRSPVSRRTVLKGLAGSLAALALGGVPRGFAQGSGQTIRLAFCSQLLCVVPYEFTQARGFFADEGLDVELVYTRGGSAAMQALQGGAVEYAATSFDAALSAFANGADVRRFATTGRLPLFALATAPGRADALRGVADLSGRTIGVSALGNGDHILALYLLQRGGVDAESVSFATLGVNLYDALRVGQVDAGMVQEPSLSLLQDDGARVLFNAMRIEDTTEVFGGAYEFMGVSVRRDEVEERTEQMRALGRALGAGLAALKEAPVQELVDALPSELVAGGDVGRLARILERYRDSLYPDSVAIDVEACRRVEEAHRLAGVREERLDLDTFLNLDVIGRRGG